MGVVRDIDLLARGVKEEFGRLKAIEHATTELITLSQKDTVAKAIAVFRDNNISRTPIVENGKLAGIITVYDIVTRFIIPREKIKYRMIKAEG